MLPHEIEPFADHHIEALTDVKKLLLDLELDLNDLDQKTLDRFMAARNKINNAQNAFIRFKVCMADEVKMKERFRIQARDCRLHHKDQ